MTIKVRHTHGDGVIRWRTSMTYGVGARVVFRGADLVCTRAHQAGVNATTPWDPGAGWPVEKAATLWTPRTPDDASILLQNASEVRCVPEAVRPE